MNDKKKMTVEDFCQKLNQEGITYAFLEYGLSYEDLDENEDPDFYDLVKTLTHKFDYIAQDLNKLERYIDENAC